jgi:hypothetical protein
VGIGNSSALVVSGGVLFFGALIGYLACYCKLAGCLRELARFRTKYFRVAGWHNFYGMYQLDSLDGGLTWYATADHSDGRCTIEGPMERVYPGLSNEPGVFSKKENPHSAVVGECMAHQDRHGKKEKSTDAAARAVEVSKELPVLTGLEFGHIVRPLHIHQQAVCMRLRVIED